MASRSDRKAAVAAAKAAKAQAKALRPWYRKKRYWLLALVIVIVAVSVVASTSGNNKATPPATAAGCAAHHASFTDEHPRDCFALANGSTTVLGYVTTATWERTTDSLGTKVICATITQKNTTSGTLDYNELFFRLQTPSGQVEDSNLESVGTALNSGSLVTGGSVKGTVCFDDPGQSGTYIGIFKPDPFNADRGVWLFKL